MGTTDKQYKHDKNIDKDFNKAFDKLSELEKAQNGMVKSPIIVKTISQKTKANDGTSIYLQDASGDLIEHKKVNGKIYRKEIVGTTIVLKEV